jgi:small subunit ribosomal protein S7
MARRQRKIKRPEILPDPVYGSVLVSKFINRMMLDGKKTKAEKIFYDAMDVIKEKTGEEPYAVFEKAVQNIMPDLEVRSRRVGGASYQVPVEVREERKQTLALRWLVTITRQRKERGMVERLANEIIDAYKEAGNTVKKKVETHKMAEANRAFAHLKW